MEFSFGIIYLYLLTQVIVVYCCTDVLTNCFAGQYDYTDADYLPFGLHLSVLEGNSAAEEEKFCRNYQQLEICVRQHIFSCSKKDPIWKKWAATELMNSSICSLQSKQAINLYKNCSEDVNTRQAIRQCSHCLSWNVSTYNLATKPENVNALYTEFKEKYQECMNDAISSACPNEVTAWLSKHFAASYFSQLCTSLPAADCATSNPVIAKEQQCEATYNQDLLTFDITNICSFIQDYVQCVVDAVVEECGAELAEQAKPRIISKRRDMMDLMGCTLANIEIGGASGKKEVDCTESKTCQMVANPFCASLPYSEAMFPNSLGHGTLYTAQQAMSADNPTLYKEHRSSMISCFLCSLYLPVCSDLRESVLPCRSLCALVKESCAGSWNEAIQCQSLPSEGFCIDAAQCHSLDTTATYTTDTDTDTDSDTESKTIDNLKIIIPVCVAAVVLLAIALVAVRKGISRNTENVVYRMKNSPRPAEQPMEVMTFENNTLTTENHYEEICDK